MLKKPTYKELEQRVRDLEKAKSEHKQTEAALAKSDEMLGNILAASSVGLAHAVDRKIAWANEAMVRLFRFTHEKQYLGKDTALLYADEEEYKRVGRITYEMQQASQLIEFDARFRRHDSSFFDGFVRVNLLNPENPTKGIIVSIVDITKRKQAEEALKASEQKYRLLADNVTDIIWTVDSELRFTYISPSVEKLRGFTSDEAMKISLEETLTPGSYQKAIEIIEEELGREGKPGVSPDRSRTLELEHYCKDGSILVGELTVSFMRDKQGMPTGIIGTTRDITDRKRAEEESRGLQNKLTQAQKMESIGTLAGGIAHNFNNVLMGIQGCISLMMIDKDASHPDYEHLKGIEEYVTNATELTRDLLSFARGGKYEVKPTDLNELIKHENRMFGRTKKELTVHGKYEKELWVTEVDQGQIQQVLLNLYVNAWQAMPGGGDLYIQTENVMLDENYVKPFDMTPGRYVRVSVTDTGIGMDEETRQKVFDPFFSTKDVGQGAGLGLASVYGVVKNHGGFVNVYSERGEGTTFTIYLPASEKKVVEKGPEPERDEVRYGQGTILLVDDEDMIINVGQKMLEKLGYSVLIARSGKEALDMYGKQGEEIDLIILDMIMPEMNGGETYDRVKEIDQGAKVLLSSGYSINGQAQEILDRGCNGFIQKPFTLKGISQKISEVLDKGQGDEE